MHVYNEKEERQIEILNAQSEVKKIKKFKAKNNVYTERDEKIKERPVPQLNKESDSFLERPG